MNYTKQLFKFSGLKATFKIMMGMYILLTIPAAAVGFISHMIAFSQSDLDLLYEFTSGWNGVIIPAIAMFEEVFFVFPVVLLYSLSRDVNHRVVSKILVYLALIALPVLSYQFMIGHAYQGAAMYPKGLYVLYSCFMMSRYGLPTSMAAHFLYDFSILGMAKILLTIAVASGQL